MYGCRQCSQSDSEIQCEEPNVLPFSLKSFALRLLSCILNSMFKWWSWLSQEDGGLWLTAASELPYFHRIRGVLARWRFYKIVDHSVQPVQCCPLETTAYNCIISRSIRTMELYKKVTYNSLPSLNCIYITPFLSQSLHTFNTPKINWNFKTSIKKRWQKKSVSKIWRNFSLYCQTNGYCTVEKLKHFTFPLNGCVLRQFSYTQTKTQTRTTSYCFNNFLLENYSIMVTLLWSHVKHLHLSNHYVWCWKNRATFRRQTFQNVADRNVMNSADAIL